MRALLQRVSEAEVKVDGQSTGKIGTGLMVLVCAMQGDGDDAPAKLAARVAKCRIFRDEAGKMNKSVQDIGGEVLVVSQFTLSADTRSGNRPGFSTAAAPDRGQELYESFSQALRELGLVVQNGIFGADMKVSLVNDGPVTIWMDSTDRA
ncbi:D-aminoacyl-tRNA deacylase [Paracoccus sp. (in: a-proteobacteria)]|uniref:D-aminoacyl-tRNA deacylase n=1 Tax=Paracoccus sp. TaxID=267 RepID=UPI00289EEEC1|nr:D-aminoacyl-tRNA deacylase [Paracoccus sp. (in: a-proteobacteria)]